MPISLAVAIVMRSSCPNSGSYNSKYRWYQWLETLLDLTRSKSDVTPVSLGGARDQTTFMAHGVAVQTLQRKRSSPRRIRLMLRDVIAHCKRLEGPTASPHNRLTLEEMSTLRQSLHACTPNHGFLPWRRSELGESLATVSFTNFKGGSAKTTSCVHFAQYLARRGYRVLLIDLDSQASATAQFGIDPSSEVGLEDSFAAWTNARDEGRLLAAKSICQRTYWPSIDLVPGGPSSLRLKSPSPGVRRTAESRMFSISMNSQRF